jgi:two-component system response regulator AtoC
LHPYRSIRFMKPPLHPRIEGLGEHSISLPDLIDEIPLGVLVVDTDQRVMLLNRPLEALTGFLSQEAHGIPCRYILRSNVCVEGCPVRDVAMSGGSSYCEANIVNRNRQKIPVRFTAAPILGSNGEVVAFVKSVEDMRFLQQADEQTGGFFFGKLIGKSPEMQRVFRVLPAIAQTDSSVLITGQTGTGKDYVAEAVHNASLRAKGPFIKVNCGALPETLLESELFGHQKGAFTGAVDNKPGRFRLAHNGTLYLTEIGDLPLNLQVKLLSFLDDQVVYPLGSTRGVHVDVRIIAATHRNLETMVREGRFREDLLFRLNVIRLHLPPLCERGEDIGMLMDHFLQIFNSRFKKKVMKFSEGTRQKLLQYRFPGNVRELRNIVENAVNLCDGDQILPEHIPAYLDAAPSDGSEHDGDQNASSSGLVKFHAEPAGDREWNPPPALDPMNWNEAERRMILDAMLKARGHRTKAAKYLGWGRSTLWRKLKEHGIVP